MLELPTVRGCPDHGVRPLPVTSRIVETETECVKQREPQRTSHPALVARNKDPRISSTGTHAWWAEQKREHLPKTGYEAKGFGAESMVIVDAAEGIISRYQAQGFSLTLRQLYYQSVGRGLRPKGVTGRCNDMTRGILPLKLCLKSERTVAGAGLPMPADPIRNTQDYGGEDECHDACHRSRHRLGRAEGHCGIPDQNPDRKGTVEPSHAPHEHDWPPTLAAIGEVRYQNSPIGAVIEDDFWVGVVMTGVLDCRRLDANRDVRQKRQSPPEEIAGLAMNRSGIGGFSAPDAQ